LRRRAAPQDHPGNPRARGGGGTRGSRGARCRCRRAALARAWSWTGSHRPQHDPPHPDTRLGWDGAGTRAHGDPRPPFSLLSRLGDIWGGLGADKGAPRRDHLADVPPRVLLPWGQEPGSGQHQGEPLHPSQGTPAAAPRIGPPGRGTWAQPVPGRRASPCPRGTPTAPRGHPEKKHPPRSPGQHPAGMAGTGTAGSGSARSGGWGGVQGLGERGGGAQGKEDGGGDKMALPNPTAAHNGRSSGVGDKTVETTPAFGEGAAPIRRGGGAPTPSRVPAPRSCGADRTARPPVGETLPLLRKTFCYKYVVDFNSSKKKTQTQYVSLKVLIMQKVAGVTH